MIEFIPTYIPLNAEVRPRFTPAGERWFRENILGPLDQWIYLGEFLDVMERLGERYAHTLFDGVEIRVAVPSRPLTRAELEQAHELKVEAAIEKLNRRLLQLQEERRGILRVSISSMGLGPRVVADAISAFRLAGWSVDSGAGSQELLFNPPAEDQPQDAGGEG